MKRFIATLSLVAALATLAAPQAIAEGHHEEWATIESAPRNGAPPGQLAATFSGSTSGVYYYTVTTPLGVSAIGTCGSTLATAFISGLAMYATLEVWTPESLGTTQHTWQTGNADEIWKKCEGRVENQLGTPEMRQTIGENIMRCEALGHSSEYCYAAVDRWLDKVKGVLLCRCVALERGLSEQSCGEVPREPYPANDPPMDTTA